MNYTSEEYTKFYIIQALFKLMNKEDYEKISIVDICKKAGVGRATFYRHFKNKEDIIIYYFDHNHKEFILKQKYIPRCKEDYVDLIVDILKQFKEQKEPIKLIKKANLDYIYLDYLNKNFNKNFLDNYCQEQKYLSYGFSGMLFNICMAWLEDDCVVEEKDIAIGMVDSLNIK